MGTCTIGKVSSRIRHHSLKIVNLRGGPNQIDQFYCTNKLSQRLSTMKKRNMTQQPAGKKEVKSFLKLIIIEKKLNPKILGDLLTSRKGANLMRWGKT